MRGLTLSFCATSLPIPEMRGELVVIIRSRKLEGEENVTQSCHPQAPPTVIVALIRVKNNTKEEGMGEEEEVGQDGQPDEEQIFGRETFWRLHRVANIFIVCLLFNLNRDF